MDFGEKLGRELLFFDGAMGTRLQKLGLGPGEPPEIWNLTHPDAVCEIHKSYVEAGCDILTANTFGANALRLAGTGFSVREVVKSGLALAKKAAVTAARPVYTALDLSSTGKLLQPLGELPFETAYDLYREQVSAGTEAGADLILIETMSDLYETKAAVLAAKENSALPVLVTLTFNEKGTLLTGADVPTAVFTLEGLGADGIGLNCGLGPGQMLGLVWEMSSYSSTPLIVNPNAGLPECVGGVTTYGVGAAEFAAYMKKIVGLGAACVGGCCGTTPEHIRETVNLCRGLPVIPVKAKNFTAVTSASRTAFVGERPLVIGERINPTGKKKLRAALLCGDTAYLASEAVSQADRGADVLDVNVGLPELDEKTVLPETVRYLQSVTDLPLQLDTADCEAMEKALRLYNGKPLLNSVSGKRESMERLFPLAKKYGGVLVCLTLDENGIPDTAEGRVRIAQKLIRTAAACGIPKKELLIDPLTLAVSAGGEQAKVTLEALRLLRDLGVNTVLGVSNISFGLPDRESLNAAFFTMALQNGLSAGIVNPKSESLMNACYSFCALAGLDKNFETYISRKPRERESALPDCADLKSAVEKGLKQRAAELARELLQKAEPLSVVSSELIPALNDVGRGFEAGSLFLPQLLRSSEAAKAAFVEVRAALLRSGGGGAGRGKVMLATVEGDVHDIGKNIVRALLENYGFEVLDLGRDVPAGRLVAAARKEKIRLAGLSALMTTTVANMELAVRALHEQCPGCKVMVGGAVLTKAYADRIGADFYSPDALGAVRYAEAIFGT